MREQRRSSHKLIDKQQAKELSIEMIIISLLAGVFATGGQVLATIIAASVIYLVLLGLLVGVNGLRGRRYAECQYTAKSLEDFLTGGGDAWDWDAFTSTSSRWPELERIRRAALAVDLPLDDDGRRVLEHLLEDAKTFCADNSQ